MNTKILELFKNYECDIRKIEFFNRDEYQMYLFIPLEDISVLMTTEFKSYLERYDDFEVVLTPEYIVVDLVHFITEWLCEDIESYFKNENVTAIIE